MRLPLLTGRALALACMLLAGITGCGGGGGSSAPPYHQPTAAAGNGQTVNKQATVSLDGSGSSDADGHPLTYSWAQTAGPAATLSSSTTAKPTFTAPGTSGTMTFQLTVSNGQMTSPASSVTITVQDRAPVAATPASMTVAPTSQIVLDGSGSSDPDQDALTYAWTQTSGPAVTLTAATAMRPSFSAPGSAAVFVFSLIVSDGEKISAASTETISVVPGTGITPVANAGPDMTVAKRQLVGLYGTASRYNSIGGLSYNWQQTSGTAVTLQDADTANPTFVAPAATGDLVFKLTVVDSGVSSAPSAVTVHVKNFAPTVTGVALSPVGPKRNDPISVTASINDLDGDTLTLSYAWTRNGTADSSVTGSSYPLGKQAKGDIIGVTVTATDGDLTTSVNASASIADSPATLTATNPPTTATYGAPLTFNLTAADDDGDATGPIEIEFGPAGFSIDASGTVTWTPNGPLFARSTDTNWGARLKNAPAVKLHGTISVKDASRPLPLFRSNLDIPRNNNSLEIADFDGTGTQQALINGFNSVYLLKKSGSAYAQSWAFPFDVGGMAPIQAVASGDVDGDGHREIFFSAGTVLVKLDGVTRLESGRYGSPSPPNGSPTAPYCVGLRYGDVDGDGKGDLVCLGADSTFYSTNAKLIVIDPATMQVKWQTDSLNLGTSIAIGNVDADSDVEIVTSNGYVYDGRTHANKWAYGPGFGTTVDIGDVMADGTAKIVGLVNSSIVRVFDAVQKSPLWEIPAASGPGALRVTDLDGTGPAEIIVGDSSWGNVTVYRYNTSTHVADQVAQIPAQGYGVSAVAAGDLNGDGQKELVWGSDIGSSGRDYLVVASWTPPSGSVLWSGPSPAELDGPFVGGKLAHLGAGTDRLMFLSPRTDSGYDGARLIALDPATGALSVSAQIDTNWSAVAALDVADVMGSGIDAMLIGTAALYNDYFTAYDFASDTKLWSSVKGSDGAAAITHADLNGDGKQDLVAITNSGYVQAYDVANQTLIYSSTGLGGGADVAVADLDGDGTREIVALGNSQVVVFSAASGGGYVQKAQYSLTGGSGLLVADTNGDGKPEIYVLGAGSGGYGTMAVMQLDRTLTLLATFPVANGALSIHLEQSAFARKNLVIGTTGDQYSTGTSERLEIIDPSNGNLVWQSPGLEGYVPKHSLSFYDLHNNGKLQLVLGTSLGMLVTQ